MKPRIIVADDSTAIQKVVKIAFASFASEVAMVQNFSELKSQLVVDEWDLVIADASLPGLVEKEDFSQLENLVQERPLILLAGSYDTVDLSALENSKINYHIVRKPFDASELINIVKLNLPKALFEQPKIDPLPQPSPSKNEKTPAKVYEDKKMEPKSDLRPADDENHEQLILSGGYPEVATNKERKGIPAFSSDHAHAGNITPGEVETKKSKLMNESDLLRQAIKVKQNFESSTNANDHIMSMASKSDLLTLIEETVKSQLDIYAKEMILSYCQKNFKVLAEGVIVKEIEKLLIEKNRLQGR